MEEGRPIDDIVFIEVMATPRLGAAGGKSGGVGFGRDAGDGGAVYRGRPIGVSGLYEFLFIPLPIHFERGSKPTGNAHLYGTH